MKTRIALFIDYLNSGAFQQKLFEGLEKAVENTEIQLFVFNGGSAGGGPDFFLEQNNLAYSLFNPDDFDGLLISTSLASYTTPEKFRSFVDSIGSIPKVLLGPGPVD
ncbi:MAG: hypothetical protein JW874_08005, partial [Spirochaetales bacterium]|nr:hypothetical protein [Spirochaetales bacterium]